MLIAAVLGGPLPVLPGEESVPYDPLVGIERSGRIPKRHRPDDLVHPERWHYVPEGRIAPGNLFQRFLVTSFIAPLVRYDGDVGAGGGVAITDIDFRGQRRQEFAGIFLSATTRGEQRYGLLWKRWSRQRDLPDGGIVQEERSFWRAYAGYRRSLTLRYFGPGPTSENEDETSYLDEAFFCELDREATLPVWQEHLVLHLGTRHEYHNLARGRVDDVPSMHDYHPESFRPADDHYCGWLRGGLRYDTRDSLINPYRGWHLGLRVDAAPLQTHGHRGGTVGVDGTWTTPVPSPFHTGGDAGEEHPPTDTVALGFSATGAWGDLPFWALPSLGGSDTLRGHLAGRFRDRCAWHATGEYRFWFLPRGVHFTDRIRIERIGGAAFLEFGTVAEKPEDLPRVSVHHSYGAGLRFTFERTALFRADIGFGEDAVNFSFKYGLSF